MTQLTQEMQEMYGPSDKTSKIWAEKFAPLKGKIKLTDKKFDSVESLIQQVQRAIAEIVKPKYVFIPTIYEETGTATSIQISLRPYLKHATEHVDFKFVRGIATSETMADNLIDEIAAWCDRYEEVTRLNHNLDMLNSVLEEVTTEGNIPYKVKVKLGSNPAIVTDDEVVFGYTEDQVFALKDMSLFDTNLVARSEGQKAKLMDALKEVPTPLLVCKSKADILKQLGFYTRKTPVSFARATVRRDIEKVRVGTGYVLTDDYLGFITKTAVSDKELEGISKDSVLVLKNEKPSTPEKEKGLTNIVVSWLLSPVDVKEGVPVDGVELSSIVK